jgi:hypothetical protein
LKVLIQIAKWGPQTKYVIEKRTKVNHASVHEAVEYFVEVGDVKGEKVGVTRTGQAKTEYSLDFPGIWEILKKIEAEDYDEVFPSFGRFLPLLFGKWFYFRKQGLAEEFLRTLGYINREVDFWGIARTWKLDNAAWVPNEVRFDYEGYVMDRFGDFVFMLQPAGVKERWLKAFRGDGELRQWAIERIERLLKEGRRLMDSHEKNLEMLKN